MIPHSIPTITQDDIFYSNFEEICKTYDDNFTHNGWFVYVSQSGICNNIIKHFPI